MLNEQARTLGLRRINQSNINADLIAAGLSPLAPERELMDASRIFLREIEERIAAREDFAFETTLAGRTYLRLIERLRRGYWGQV